jgi:hypothetical protein
MLYDTTLSQGVYVTMPEEPKPGAYDWIVGGTKEHTIDIPLDPMTPGKTLRVEITAKARVSPSYPWGVIILTWGIAVLVLLGLIAAKPAHAGVPNDSPYWGQNAITATPGEHQQWANPGQPYIATPLTSAGVLPDWHYRTSDGVLHTCHSWRQNGFHVMDCK